MRAQNKAHCTPECLTADVAPPQLATDASLHCHFSPESAIVRAGRTQAVCLLKRGLRGKIALTFQEDWSRGCRRAHVSFLVFACWHLLPLAHRKKKKSYLLKSPSLWSRPIPANTSNILRRASRGNPVWCAAVFDTLKPSALAPHHVLHYTAAVPFSQDRSPC